jgi:hypothetical protein
MLASPGKAVKDTNYMATLPTSPSSPWERRMLASPGKAVEDTPWERRMLASPEKAVENTNYKATNKCCKNCSFYKCVRNEVASHTRIVKLPVVFSKRSVFSTANSNTFVWLSLGPLA